MTERSLVPSWLEHRPERSYDETDPGHVVMPNGSLVGSYDRAFLAAATREALALRSEVRR